MIKRPEAQKCKTLKRTTGQALNQDLVDRFNILDIKLLEWKFRIPKSDQKVNDNQTQTEPNTHQGYETN